MVCRYSPEAKGASVRGAVDVTPSEHNVRSRVHEYGGGSFVIASDPTNDGREVIIYSNFKDQRLYKVFVLFVLFFLHTISINSVKSVDVHTSDLSGRFKLSAAGRSPSLHPARCFLLTLFIGSRTG